MIAILPSPRAALAALMLLTLSAWAHAQAAPAVRVTLSRPVYYITADPHTGAPKMPEDVEANAQTENWPAGIAVPAVFTWHVYLNWDFAPCPTRHSIENQVFTSPSPLRPDLSREIRGGMLFVYARADLRGKVVYGVGKAEVRGVNPPREAVLRAFPPSRFGLIASKVGMVESGLRQFGVGPDGGMPTVSRTFDVGMMQLNAPSGAITSPDQVWDWRANLRRGLEMLGGKRRYTELASRHAVELHRLPMECYVELAGLNFVRGLLGLKSVDFPSGIRSLSADPGSGIQPGEPDPDHVALSQVEREAIRRYNGGSEYRFGLIEEPGSLRVKAIGWLVDPTRGGIALDRGDPDYVLHVLKARSGFKLPPPTKPPRPHIHHRRRRRHRPR